VIARAGDAAPSPVAGSGHPILEWLVPLLACPGCRAPLAFTPDGLAPDDGLLRHRGGPCSEVYPVIGSIPRLLRPPHRRGLAVAKAEWFAASAERAALGEAWRADPEGGDAVVRAFDHEWSVFRRTDGTDVRALFASYFDLVRPDELAAANLILDAGCGSGRWAAEVAGRGPRVIALDLGLSVEVAREAAAGSTRVGCVQGDLLDLPVAASAVDWAYSLGVLHHLRDPERALRAIAEAVRPGGRIIVYVYYALDQRGPAFRLLFRAVDLVRRLTSRSPRPVVSAVSTAIALLVYWPLARASALLARTGLRGLADALPLSFYRGRTLRTMRNDSLDRFGTTVERRYTREGFRALLGAAGLGEVTISPLAPYWHGTGTRPR